MSEDMRVLEDRVLSDAIRWFEENPDHFTPETYLVDLNGDDTGPGREVVAACAIGGVEQALWRVTGRAISGEERRRFAYAGREGYIAQPSPRDEVANVYWGVMHRLNLEARRRMKLGEYDEFLDEEENPDLWTDMVADVEDVTQLAAADVARDLMLDVFRSALVGSRVVV